jgi:hypothetical protein
MRVQPSSWRFNAIDCAELPRGAIVLLGGRPREAATREEEIDLRRTEPRRGVVKAGPLATLAAHGVGAGPGAGAGGAGLGMAKGGVSTKGAGKSTV